MKEKPCSTEVPSMRKGLPGGTPVTARLTLVVPTAWVPKGCSSHSSSSVKSFRGTRLEHQGASRRSARNHAGLVTCLSQGSSTHVFLQSSRTDMACFTTKWTSKAHAGPKRDRNIAPGPEQPEPPAP